MLTFSQEARISVNQQALSIVMDSEKKGVPFGAAFRSTKRRTKLECSWFVSLGLISNRNWY